MIPRLFDIENGSIVPSEHCYTIAVLKEIMDKYPRETHLKIYTYLQYMTFPDPDKNPFFNAPEDEKEEMILRDIKADFTPESDLVPEALAFCKKIFDTPTWRAFRAIKTALDKLARYMETTTITHGRDGSVMPMLKVAKEFREIRESYKGVYNDLKEEQGETTRGGVGKAYDQR